MGYRDPFGGGEVFFWTHLYVNSTEKVIFFEIFQKLRLRRPKIGPGGKNSENTFFFYFK